MLNKECKYRKQIEEKGFLVANIVGTSMMPLLRQSIDTVKLVKIERPLKKYDVVLYMRPNGKYVLHRILKVKKNKYNICGDNQTTVEKNVPHEWIIAVMEGFYRDDFYIEIDNLEYIKYYKKTVSKRPFKEFKRKVKRLFAIIFKRK